MAVNIETSRSITIEEVSALRDKAVILVRNHPADIAFVTIDRGGVGLRTFRVTYWGGAERVVSRMELESILTSESISLILTESHPYDDGEDDDIEPDDEIEDGDEDATEIDPAHTFFDLGMRYDLADPDAPIEEGDFYVNRTHGQSYAFRVAKGPMDNAGGRRRLVYSPRQAQACEDLRDEATVTGRAGRHADVQTYVLLSDGSGRRVSTFDGTTIDHDDLWDLRAV